ncbi:hypothetical protein HGRIS_011565 [Hohenbuehelia grisea]|uniref:Aquaporin-like protein n=1 Tax=Hohenbuehelia grisea TaxID=104357 RepID=A0ABR3JVI0_9AGAR
MPVNLFASIVEDSQAAVLEFVGTVTFLLLALGGIQAGSAAAGDSTGPPDVQQLLYISISMGLGLLVSAWLFFRITGALFNPNISLALFLVGVIKPVRFVLYCIAQLAGAIAAAALVRGLTSAPLAVNTTLSSRTSVTKGVFIEMFVTAALVLSVLMLAAEKHESTPFAPVGIGLTLFAGLLFSGFYTGGSMNTARSFGPAVVSGFPDPHHWVYWVGPFLGSLLAALLYSLLIHYRYWTLVPNQATMNPEGSPDDPFIRAQALATSDKSMQRHENPMEGGPRNTLIDNRSGAGSSGLHEREKGQNASPV